MTTSRAAEHLTATVARLAHVNAALSVSDEYEANGLLPPDQRRPLARPTLARGGLKELQRMLVQRIGELEGIPRVRRRILRPRVAGCVHLR